jgi:uncharacterized membrane protein YfcA
MPILLIILFFVTAVLYAAVGFGGGSTYNALLVLTGTDYRILPTIALACNVIVVTGGMIKYAQTGALSLRRMLPFLITSIPAAWIGGRIPISETVFVGLLGIALFLSGARLALQKEGVTKDSALRENFPLPVALLSGGGIGLISGLVGIGGGIFLAPVLYLARWGNPRQIAAACSLFILLNSLSGLGGQITKLQDHEVLSLALPYWPLLITVLLGGQIGSWLGAKGLKASWMKKLTAILILYVSVRLIIRFIALVT